MRRVAKAVSPFREGRMRLAWGAAVWGLVAIAAVIAAGGLVSWH
jgi:hypothetical protein